jgi:cell fate (sporulation/competence/biofilm development) regulator YlbF (YheA/YmcA/DUF963 family)
MPVDSTQILDAATKLGQLVAQHPAVGKYRDAQKAVADDVEAGRLLSEFNRQLENLARMEASGVGITDAQRHQLEAMQSQIASHLKIKAMHLAQVEFVDLLRRVNQTIQRQLTEGGAGSASAAPASAPTGPRLVM